MDTVTYLIILRLLHISLGVFWAGAAIYMASFVVPAIQASGPEGTKFMQQLARTNGLPKVMLSAATLNVLSGLLLIWKLSNGLQPEFMGSAHGIILSTGGTLAITAYLIGILFVRPTVEKVAVLGMQIAKSGGKPDDSQLQQMMAFRKKIFSANKMVAILLGVTVVLMSIVRYF